MEKRVGEGFSAAGQVGQRWLFDNRIPAREGSSVPAEAAPGLAGPDTDSSARAGEAFLKAVRERGCRSIRAVRVEFRPFRATLYSFRIRSGVARVKMHAAFQEAPDEVLCQAAHLMLGRRRGGGRLSERRAFDAFVRGLPAEAFSLPGARRSAQRAREEPGVCRSLPESFRRVNERYFGGRMPSPRLCWSPAHARRVVGTYHGKSDRILVTRRLDSTRVPEFVLDFVMYHELLHKALGTGRHRDGRRRVHGPEFRRLERRFQGYRQAEEWLGRL